MSDVVLNTDLPLKPFIRGKVRDTYELGDVLLMVATDRLSAFDVVLPTGIPDKGRVLNLLSAFWFTQTEHLVPNHVLEVITDSTHLNSYFPVDQPPPAGLSERAMIVKKAKRLPVECVVRGYLAGSGWAEYRKSGTVCGLVLPAGLTESQELPEPIFTPTSKADTGHDLPLTQQELVDLVGTEMARRLEEMSLAVYNFCRRYAITRGFIIADTKMEFGLDSHGLILIDELLTPDSSRFWDIAKYEAGRPQDSFDKQPVRDWLDQSGWNKEPPGPSLPPDVAANTAARYRQAYERLTDKVLS
jgi:phosphoribosylaminoimidazole-succinocarboxamide synthase